MYAHGFLAENARVCAFVVEVTNQSEHIQMFTVPLTHNSNLMLQCYSSKINTKEFTTYFNTTLVIVVQ